MALAPRRPPQRGALLLAMAPLPMLAMASLLLPACPGLPGRGAAGPRSLGVSDRGGAWRVYEIDPAGGAARLIGSRDAFDRSYRDLMPARLPDGRVVFVSDRDGNAEIYLASADGAAVTRLTRDPPDRTLARADTDPAPFGRDRILFARSEPGALEAAPRDLWVMGTDGEGLRRLIGGPADDRAPAGAPDGRSFAFVSDTPEGPRVFLTGDPPGSGPLNLSARAGPGAMAVLGGRYADGAPAFLPGGSVVFSRGREGEPPHLFVMAGAGGGGGLRQVTDGLTLPFGADEPVPLADGTILFVTGPVVPEDETGPVRYAVYRIAAGGFNLARVTRADAAYDDFTRRLSRR
jgi:hypothetical protein